MIESLIRNLETRSKLTDDEKMALAALRWEKAAYKSEQIVSRLGDRLHASTLLTSGLMARSRVTPQGERQIVAVYVPGDFLDLQSLLLPVLDHDIITLRPSTCAKVAHRELFALIRKNPRLGLMLWRLTLIDAAIHREWMLGLGRQSAAQRTAHFLCELYCRLETVGLAAAGRMQIELSQVQMGDILGLSYVHVNRTVQELRSTQIIGGKGKHIEILDRGRLCSIGNFDPHYLHLEQIPVAL